MKKTIAPILLAVCLAVVICMAFAGCAQKQSAAPDKDQTGSYEIDTGLGKLCFPVKWKETVRTDVSRNGDSAAVRFSTVMEGREYELFTVTVGAEEGEPVGSLTDETGAVRSVFIKASGLEPADDLTSEQKDSLYAMQEDLNFVIDNLK